MLQVGQQVICIDDTIDPKMLDDIKNDFQQWVKEGDIYTIRDLIYNEIGVITVLLHELVNSPRFFPKTIGRMQEPGFSIRRFAPLDSALEVLNEVNSHANIN